MSRTLLNRCSALWVAGVGAIAKLVQDEGEVKSYQEQYECVEQLSLLCGLLRTTLHLLFRMHTRVEIMRNGIFMSTCKKTSNLDT